MSVKKNGNGNLNMGTGSVKGNRLDPHGMAFPVRLFWFLFLNFLVLALGSMNTGEVLRPGGWYAQLNRAPWEPPGWVFGFAWTSIMICFSVFLALLFAERKPYNHAFFYACLMLNGLWSPVFFQLHEPFSALLLLLALDILISVKFIREVAAKRTRSLLLLPYFVWLLVALSLNIWVVAMN